MATSAPVTLDCCGGAIVQDRPQHEEWCTAHIRTALGWLPAEGTAAISRNRAETALEALEERSYMRPGHVTIPDLLPLARQLYQEASIGCCLHLSLASLNMDDETLRRSIYAASD